MSDFALANLSGNNICTCIICADQNFIDQSGAQAALQYGVTNALWVDVDNMLCEIGWSWNGTTFTPPISQ
jgi:hypothetical protein